jgi:hypothetical protein
MTNEHNKNPVGAPPKGPYANRNAALNMRVTKNLKERLMASATANGYSLSQEVELRLDHSFSLHGLDANEFGTSEVLSICRLIGMMMRVAQQLEGEQLWESREAHQELKDAIVTILDAFGPDGGMPQPHKDETRGQQRGRSRLTQLRQNQNKDAPVVDDGNRLQHLSDQDSWIEIWYGLGSLAAKLEKSSTSKTSKTGEA